MDCIDGLGGCGSLSSTIVCWIRDRDKHSDAILGLACHHTDDSLRILCLRESFSPFKASCSLFKDTSLAILALCLSDKSENFIWSSKSFSMASSCLVESQEHLASSCSLIHCQTDSVIK